jgi:hypothetical protein
MKEKTYIILSHYLAELSFAGTLLFGHTGAYYQNYSVKTNMFLETETMKGVCVFLKNSKGSVVKQISVSCTLVISTLHYKS